MSWLRRMLAHFGPAKPDEALLKRADHVLKNVDSVRITVVPKNARALAELRRLDAQARR